MVFQGQVKKGVVVLEPSADLADGTWVSVRPLKRKPAQNGAKRSGKSRLAKHAGKAKGLPRDAARNLDHYLYGLPKR
ncbi:MAG: hypothetical protein HYS13_00245 [Planctomycetia bacterium]|nr:hypothetical protein [Planctomycetia bacterium]